MKFKGPESVLTGYVLYVHQSGGLHDPCLKSPARGKSVDIPFALNLWFQLVSFAACLPLVGLFCIPRLNI